MRLFCGDIHDVCLLIQYMEGATFYRMDYKSKNQAFVVQFGYRGVPEIDQCWDNNLTSLETCSVKVPPGVRS